MRKLIIRFCNWRARYCVNFARRSLAIFDYRGAVEWARLATVWEGQARRFSPRPTAEQAVAAYLTITAGDTPETLR
jgi:hypothetical protein